MPFGLGTGGKELEGAGGGGRGEEGSDCINLRPLECVFSVAVTDRSNVSSPLASPIARATTKKVTSFDEHLLRNRLLILQFGCFTLCFSSFINALLFLVDTSAAAGNFALPAPLPQ